MSNLTTRARRGLAAGVATVVGVGALSVLAATPASAAPTGSLNWGVSQQLFDHLSTRVLDGVSVDTVNKTFAFPEASTSVSSGVTTIDYTGSVRSAFAMGDTEYYHVTIADPSVQIATDGTATISATVSSANVGQGQAPADSVAPVEVEVVQLPTTGTLRTGFTAAPAAAGDFSAEFFDGLSSGIEAHFKQTSTATPPVDQPKKRPAGFVASGTAPAAGTSVVKSSTATGFDFAVTGTNFNSSNPANMGLYLGLAPAGGLPDVSSPAGSAAFLGTAYVPKGALVDGALSKTISVAAADLVAGTDYSVYTWMAHTHASTEFDTESNVGVLKVAQTAAPKTTVTKQVSASNVKLGIKGSGFVGGDANYMGIYVGVAETGKRPDLSDQANMDLFAGSNWIMAGQIVNGAFATTLDVDPAYLKAGASYSLYTWQAHRYSTTALDSETKLGVLKAVPPVVKPPVIVKKAPAIALKWKKKSTAKKQGAVTFKVKKTAAKAATGKATFKITYTKKVTKKVKKGNKVIRKKVNKTFVKTVKNRAVKKGATKRLTVPKGTKKVTVKYSGDAYYKKGAKTLRR